MDLCFAPNRVNRSRLYIQPVMPLGLDRNLHLIIRTLLQVIDGAPPRRMTLLP